MGAAMPYDGYVSHDHGDPAAGTPAGHLRDTSSRAPLLLPGQAETVEDDKAHVIPELSVACARSPTLGECAVGPVLADPTAHRPRMSAHLQCRV